MKLNWWTEEGAETCAATGNDPPAVLNRRDGHLPQHFRVYSELSSGTAGGCVVGASGTLRRRASAQSPPAAPSWVLGTHGAGVETTLQAVSVPGKLTVFYCKEIAVETWDTEDTQSRIALSEEGEKDPYIQKL